jgi:DNA-binding NtrC family response regulator
MSFTIVLAVGVDSWQLMTHDPIWKSAGYIVISVGSVEEAVRHFKAGDFDMVLLGYSIPAEKRERLTFLIRSLGLRVPVAAIAKSPGDCDSFVDVTLRNDTSALLAGIGALMANKARTPMPSIMAHQNAD